MEATSRLMFALVVAVGVACSRSSRSASRRRRSSRSRSCRSLGIGLRSGRRGREDAPGEGIALEDEVEESGALDAASAGEPGGSAEPEFTLANGTGFAAAVLLIMVCEQTFLNAGPLLVKATEGAEGVALAGFVFNVLLIARAPLQLFQAIQTSILPHLTKLRAGGETDPFRRSINVTLMAIGAFAAVVALVMLAIGPWLMDLVFGGDFSYDRGGLVMISIGMGLYLRPRP